MFRVFNTHLQVLWVLNTRNMSFKIKNIVLFLRILTSFALLHSYLYIYNKENEMFVFLGVFAFTHDIHIFTGSYIHNIDTVYI